MKMKECNHTISRSGRAQFASTDAAGWRVHRDQALLPFVCRDHGLTGWNLPETPVACGVCGRPLFGSFIDLIFSDVKLIVGSGRPEAAPIRNGLLKRAASFERADLAAIHNQRRHIDG
jgi:hypothetical protein